MYIFDAILDFFFPRFCLVCGNRLHLEEQTMCIHCNLELPRTMLWKNPTDNDLVKRFWGKIPIVKAASYFYFYPKSNTANIVYAFKYHNEPYTAKYMGEMMAQEIGAAFFQNIDCLIPVPINKKREKKRGYNQSEKLAKGIEKYTQIPVYNNVIKRYKNSISQTTLDVYERYNNMSDIFGLTKESTKLRGKHCLLIDDIITTGATICACANEILKIEGTKVSILSLGCVKI